MELGKSNNSAKDVIRKYDDQTSSSCIHTFVRIIRPGKQKTVLSYFCDSDLQLAKFKYLPLIDFHFPRMNDEGRVVCYRRK